MEGRGENVFIIKGGAQKEKMNARQKLEKQIREAGGKKVAHHLKMDVITPKAKVSRARKADEYIRRGLSVKDAAQLAGVSEFWLRLRVDKSRVGTVKNG